MGPCIKNQRRPIDQNPVCRETTFPRLISDVGQPDIGEVLLEMRANRARKSFGIKQCCETRENQISGCNFFVRMWKHAIYPAGSGSMRSPAAGIELNNAHWRAGDLRVTHTPKCVPIPSKRS